jgi:hypothetical protein
MVIEKRAIALAASIAACACSSPPSEGADGGRTTERDARASTFDAPGAVRDDGSASAIDARVPDDERDGSIAAADFASRCSAPGVVRCVGFDDPADIAGGY